MAAVAAVALITFLVTLLIPALALAQTPSAPAPAASAAGPANLTAVLEKPGQYATFIKLLKDNRIDEQLNNQANTSSDGLTVLAPTDNAFNNLKPGILNGLSTQEQVQLILYHVLPKYYTFTDLQLVSNPVRTQATGNDGVWGMNFTAQNNQVNVSSGVVETQLYNPLRQQKPLAVYQLDRVLLPDELFGVKKMVVPSSSSTGNTTSSSGSRGSNVSSAEEPSPASGAAQIRTTLGFVVGLTAASMAAVFF